VTHLETISINNDTNVLFTEIYNNRD